MKKIDLYFLQYKFQIILDNQQLANRFLKFWKNFLQKNENFKTEKEWTIIFKKSEISQTSIDYKNKIIHHKHNSICELTELNNLLREAVVKISAMDGIIWLHCSGFQIGNHTFLVIGNKGDGKTTFLLNAIKKGAKFIGNDQLPLFKYNNKICTYIWRPDIKIPMDYAIQNHITNTKDSTDGEKILYLVNNKIPYNFIDAQKMSIRTKKKITLPDKEIVAKLPKDKIKQIDYLIFLNKEQNVREYQEERIIDKIKEDQETILAYKLENLEKYMPYWNKRIKSIKIEKNAYENNEIILDMIGKQTKKMLIGNRLEFETIWNDLKKSKGAK